MCFFVCQLNVLFCDVCCIFIGGVCLCSFLHAKKLKNKEKKKNYLDL